MLPKNLAQGAKILALLQEKYPGYHPLLGVAEIAHTTDDERLEFDCHKTLSKYIEPELKSVEVSVDNGDDDSLHVIFEGDYEEVVDEPRPAALEHQGPSELEAELNGLDVEGPMCNAEGHDGDQSVDGIRDALEGTAFEIIEDVSTIVNFADHRKESDS